MKKLISLLIIVIIVSCGKDKKETKPTTTKTEEKAFNDNDYVLNADYKVGDVRRYGIFPDSIHATGHPFTKKSRLETVLDLAENHGIEMSFPKGYYKTALVFKGRQNINLHFDAAEFGGMIQFLEKDSTQTKNIKLTGSVITYGGLFSRNTNKVAINKLTIKSDAIKSIYKIRSKGCHIYAKSQDITINNLIVEDLGSGSDKFKHIHGAVIINGTNTENVKIKKIHIKSSDRHGLYISGKDHLIGDVVVDKFGMGSSKGMSGLAHTTNGEEKEFKALWVNKCYDSFIENITINEKDSKGKYTAHFDSGNKNKPFTIGKFKVINNNLKIEILEEEGNGVIVEVKE
jgi:hypothetical protein